MEEVKNKLSKIAFAMGLLYGEQEVNVGEYKLEIGCGYFLINGENGENYSAEELERIYRLLTDNFIENEGNIE